VQEEAPTLKKPVLVIRKKTERMESVNLGISKLIGTEKSTIVDYISRLIEDKEFYMSMVSEKNPYGDGKASDRIMEAIEKNI
jgi:UDP-N-acetylglucosamine 2-epimerase (non-hydrolysing)